jgi:hypothetical protein
MSMKSPLTAVLTLWLLSWTCGAVAAEIIPADRLADWTPGITVGVPGGIPTDRTNLIDATKAPYNADNTGAADAQPAIMKAIAAAKDKDVIYLPAGTYRIDKPITTGWKSNITIRGAGPEETLLMAYNPGGGTIDVGIYMDWPWAKPNLKIAGNPKKGATVLNVGDTSSLGAYPNGGIGHMCCIRLKNDPSLPVMTTNPQRFDYLRRQMSRIVAKTDTTVTISPGLLFDLPESLSPLLGVAARPVAQFVGIEDLKIDATHSTSGVGKVYLKECYGCWIKNVTVQNVQNRQITIDQCLQCEVRHCYTSWGRATKSHHNCSAFLFGLSAGCLVEDNIFAHQYPLMEIDGGSSGNVFAYNLCYDSVPDEVIGASIDTNHDPHNSFNLYEGNVAAKFQSDGYWGSASHDTAFRNWFHGSDAKCDKFGICVYLNRLTRCYSIVGNVLGCKGYAWLYDNAENGFGYDQHFIYVFGLPNMGNGGFNGKTVQPSKGRFWADWASEPGKGPGAGGFQELDLDVKATTLLKGNYNYKDNGVPAGESLGSAKLPKSLYRKEKPAWFGDLNWPAFGPDTTFEKNKIPAQVRFEALEKTNSMPGHK